MNKSCNCGNIVVKFDTDKPFASARKCSCEYCTINMAEYVSDPQTVVKFKVKDNAKHKTVKHGHETAEFHECTSCGLILVTSTIKGEMYCVLNAKALGIKGYTLEHKAHDFSGETSNHRLARRKRNWSPVNTSL